MVCHDFVGHGYTKSGGVDEVEICSSALLKISQVKGSLF